MYFRRANRAQRPVDGRDTQPGLFIRSIRLASITRFPSPDARGRNGQRPSARSSSHLRSIMSVGAAPALAHSLQPQTLLHLTATDRRSFERHLGHSWLSRNDPIPDLVPTKFPPVLLHASNCSVFVESQGNISGRALSR